MQILKENSEKWHFFFKLWKFNSNVASFIWDQKDKYYCINLIWLTCQSKMANWRTNWSRREEQMMCTIMRKDITDNWRIQSCDWTLGHSPKTAGIKFDHEIWYSHDTIQMFITVTKANFYILAQFSRIVHVTSFICQMFWFHARSQMTQMADLFCRVIWKCEILRHPVW